MQRLVIFSVVTLGLSGCFGDSSSDAPPPVASVCSIPSVSPNSVEPFESQQWVIENTGQAAFSERGGVPGFDLNVRPVHQMGITGKGVNVVVVDKSVDHTHEDLCGNFLTQGSLNYLCADPTQPCDVNNPMLRLPNGDNDWADHGTAVAGIVAAPRNEKGVLGIAYNAKLMNFNALVGQEYFPSEEVFNAAFGNPESASFIFPYAARYDVSGADILNFSLGGVPGYPKASDSPAELGEFYVSGDTIDRYSLDYREGKGIIYVKSSGNNFSDIYRGNGQFLICHDRPIAYIPMKYGVSCASTNLDNGEQGLSPMIVVAAVNADGVKSSYSSTGSAVLISGLGGEYGTDSPAVLSTDVQSCQFGYSTDPSRIPDNPNCDYAHNFNGTSAAAPTITGVIALMLEANPKLTDRDVREILIQSARKLEPDFTPKTMQLNTNGPIVTIQHGWVKNAAGYEHHNQYGYGLPDALKAVNLAKTWNTEAPEKGNRTQELVRGALIETAVTKTTAHPAYRPIAEYSFEINADKLDPHFNEVFDTIELVRFTGSIETWVTNDGEHFGKLETMPSHVLLTLISPSGTPSVINEPLGHEQAFQGFHQARIVSNAFYGEPLNGTWKIQLATIYNEDLIEQDEAMIKHRLTDFYLDFMGH